MEQSAFAGHGGLHVAMIMDGNGRWAMTRGKPRATGHRKGAETVRRIVEAAPGLGVEVLTLYAFSSDNWKRPPREVAGLMRLFRSYLASETARAVQNGVRVSIIGRRDRLSPVLLRAIEATEAATAGGRKLLLRVAIDYSARDSILAAARGGKRLESRDDLARAVEVAIHSPAVREVDLLIRTGGEQRLSDFMLWECAYAELTFETCMWPEFDEARLEAAIEEFARRERRFGGLAQAAAG
jgi:undecaprenyl diphosphate synthase